MKQLAIAALAAMILSTPVTTQVRLEKKAKHEMTVACLKKSDRQPLLDADLAGDDEAFTQTLAVLRMAAMLTPDCVLFDKGEKAFVYDIDLFGSWITVAKKGQPGRWHSFKAWWE